MGMLYEYRGDWGPEWDEYKSTAHPPLEPVDRHSIVCAGCGDVLVVDCGCGLSLTDHEDESLCDDCTLEEFER
jgi:hypothetical protein